jgi:hypothetical protein
MLSITSKIAMPSGEQLEFRSEEKYLPHKRHLTTGYLVLCPAAAGGIYRHGHRLRPQRSA